MSTGSGHSKTQKAACMRSCKVLLCTWQGRRSHRKAWVASLKQAALSLVECLKRTINSAGEVAVEVVVRGRDVVVAGCVRELQPARSAARILHAQKVV